MEVATKKADLAQENELLKTQVSDLNIQVLLLTEQVAILTNRIFGRKSEQKLVCSDNQYEQLMLFNEAEFVSDITLPEPEIEEIAYKRKKPKGKRDIDFSGLPVEKVIHELPETERVCPDCGEPLHACGHDVLRRELAIIPQQYKVTEHVQTAYSCRHCEQNNIETPMKKAQVPAPVIKGSGIASPSLVAHIANQKYCLSLPLYRQEQELKRCDINLSRQTMANWLIYVSERWLSPIYQTLKNQLLASQILHADETPVQVLKEEGKKADSKSYMWLYRTGCDTTMPIVLYDYQPNRKHENAKLFLTGHSGYIHSDGYEAYHNLPPDITPVGCWAHVRRKFVELLKSTPDYNKQDSIPMHGKVYCDALFALEHEYGKMSFDDRKKARNKKSKPIMAEFFEWAKASQNSIYATARSATGKALAYALGQRTYLENVLKDGRTELSNNRAERSIKPFVIGRKNWLFANTERGATASGVIYSIIETAKENNIKPYDYLKFIFETAPNIDMNNPVALQTLLPWNAPNSCRMSIQTQMTI